MTKTSEVMTDLPEVIKTMPKLELNAAELAETLCDNILMVDSIIWLGGCWAHTPEALRDLVEDGDYDDVLLVAGYTKEQLDEARDDEDWDLIANITEELQLTDILVKFVTPSPSSFTPQVEDGKPRHGMYTWGYSNSKWFNANDIPSAVAQAVMWKDELCAKAHEAELAKAGTPTKS